MTKKSYALKTWTKSFCNNTCYFLRRAKDAHDAKEAVRAKADATDRALLHCSTCAKDRSQDPIQEHATPKMGPASCLRCGTKRVALMTAMSSGEASAFSAASKVLTR